MLQVGKHGYSKGRGLDIGDRQADAPSDATEGVAHGTSDTSSCKHICPDTALTEFLP